MGDTPATFDVSLLRRAARRAERRQRANDALRRLTVSLPFLLGSAVIAVAWVRLSALGEDVQRWLAFAFGAAALALVAAVAARFAAARPAAGGALALDRHHHSADRVTSALYFSGLPSEDWSPLIRAAVRDALVAVPHPDPRRAVPLRWPRLAWLVPVLASLLVAANGLSPLASRAIEPRPEPASPPAVVLTADDISLIREIAAKFEEGTGDEQLDGAIADFNALIEDLAQRKLERSELFHRLAELDRQLVLADDQSAEALSALARELGQSPLAKPVAEALDRAELAAAERSMRELAERLRKDPIKKRDLERLQKALDAASRESKGRVQRLEQARQALERDRRRLLGKQKKDAKPPSPADEKRQAERLERHRRQLERLDRDLSRARAAQKAMSPLDRELAEAARELMRELGDGAKHLDSGAEQMNRMARDQMTRREKEQLKEQLQRLRDLLRQGGPDKKERLERLRRFAERARGNGGGGRPGPGKGRGGRAGDEDASRRLTLGPGGQSIQLPVPGPGSGQGSPGRSGSRAGDAPGGGSQGGRGSGGDPRGKATKLDVATQDVAAAAVDTGQGAASSEVVYGAAEQGFSAARYEKVYTQYRTVAEEVLERDTIPAGYEFYVRRYFQLIRPRGDR